MDLQQTKTYNVLSFLIIKHIINWLIVLGLTTHQLLWVILCRLPEKRDRRDRRGDESEGEKRKRKMNGSVKTEEITTPPSTLLNLNIHVSSKHFLHEQLAKTKRKICPYTQPSECGCPCKLQKELSVHLQCEV